MILVLPRFWILDLAKAHGKTVAQIILRWRLQTGYIPIPAHIDENYDIFGLEFSGDEMNWIRAIDEQRRYEPWRSHPGINSQLVVRGIMLCRTKLKNARE